MTDENDNPEILDDDALNDATGGASFGKIPDLKGGTVDSFTTVTRLSKTALTGDKGDVLIQNIGFPDTSKSIKGK